MESLVKLLESWSLVKLLASLSQLNSAELELCLEFAKWLKGHANELAH